MDGMKIHWVAHSCFKVTTKAGQVIYFDPHGVGEKVHDATLILCSHEHYDHTEESSIDNMVNPKTTLICPKSSVLKLRKYKPKGIDPGEHLEVAGIKIKAVPAYNPTKHFHPKANKWVGFLVTAEGKVLYHAGDTDYIEEFKDLPPIDVAFLPVGGTYTMDFPEAAKAVVTIAPKIIVPMHAWDEDLQEFAKLVNKQAPSTRVEILQGKDLEI